MLWSLLEQSKIYLEELEIPICSKFDPLKVDEVIFFYLNVLKDYIYFINFGYLI